MEVMEVGRKEFQDNWDHCVWHFYFRHLFPKMQMIVPQIQNFT